MGRLSIKISAEHHRELQLLKLAWGKHSIDEVLEKLIKERRLEKVKALGIEVVEENSK